MKKRISILIFPACLFAGCSKTENSNPQVPSSAKTVSALIFRSADNTGLATDVSAVINADSIKAQFPYNISLSSLIPTFSFSGKSISPPDKTAHDFTNPVTYTVTAEDGSTKNYVVACANKPSTDTPTLIAGKWKILKDSLYNDGNFYILINGIPNYPAPGVYYGTTADYYDFDGNGNVDIIENRYAATGTYELLSSGRISISVFTVYYPPAEIHTLTANDAIFYWAAQSQNGGQYSRTLYLTK